MGGEIREPIQVSDGEDPDCLEIGNTGSSSGTDWRQGNVGDLVSLPDDLDSVGELQS
jgi:hypothetical protein